MNNNITTLFQNGDRFRSGKISNKCSADQSIKWVIDAYMNLQKLNKDLTIVPVMISYDRIFEQGNLSREMITGEQKEYNLTKAIQALITAQ